MNLLRRVRQRLQEKLSLASKIRLRRLFAGVVRPFRQREKYLLTAPEIRPWDENDLLLVKDTVAGKRPLAKQEGGIQTSIIIPVFNKVDFTFQCLRSLFQEIDMTTTEVIVVNNASTDETSQVLGHFGDLIQVVDNAENQGFVDACNQGAAVASGEFLLFLNNDTIVQAGWLGSLLNAVENDSSVGAVGSMFIYPDGRIQEAGGIVWKTGEAYHYGWGELPSDRKYNFTREVDYCSAASLLVRKGLFDKLGGFDRRYAPAYYEDVDLCFGIRSMGHKVIFQPLSRVIHYEGVTAGRDTAANTKTYQFINLKKFAEKWSEALDKQFENDPALAPEAANRKPGPQIIVFDERVPTPDRDAGSARIVNILKLLARIGKPVFVPMKPLPESEQFLWKEGIETANVVDYVRLIKNRDFRVAILSRPEVARALMRSIRRADRKIKIVFDMVDAHFIRLGREHKITGNQELAIEARHSKDLELKLVGASDQVWCASTADKKAVSTAVAEERIVVIPTIHALQDRGNPPKDRDGLLFIGHLSHRPNSDAIHYFMREIYPLVSKSLPSVTFFIVGSNASPEIEAYDSATVRVMGYVPDIKPLLRSARVFVAPLRFGAGVNGKIGEALSYGLPVVTTSIGAEGVGLTAGENAMIADDPEEFANSVLRVYRDMDLWHRLSESGYQHIENHFTPQIVGQKIEEGLKRLGVLGTVA
ncbi:MAG: glycosyltransferase [Pyrinomonadaceae bacterium]|nr:glycosyltransferase [Pyrinomonadaceae bacterium]